MVVVVLEVTLIDHHKLTKYFYTEAEEERGREGDKKKKREGEGGKGGERGREGEKGDGQLGLA